MITKRRFSARAIAAAFLLCMAGFALVAEPVALPSFSVREPAGILVPFAAGTRDRPDSSASGAITAGSGEWVTPLITDKPLLAGIPDGKARKVAHAGSMVMTVGGALLVAGGLATVSSGISDGMDDETMHRGALMIVAGGIVSALFSVMMRATGSTSPE